MIVSFTFQTVDSTKTREAATGVVAVVLVVLMAMAGCAAPGNNSQVSFLSSANRVVVTPSPNSSGINEINDTRAWQIPVRIDAGAVTSPPFDYSTYFDTTDTLVTSTNMGSTTANHVRRPLRGAIDSSGNAYVAISMIADATTPTNYPFIVYPFTSHLTDTWMSTTSFENMLMIGAGTVLTASTFVPLATDSGVYNQHIYVATDGKTHHFYVGRYNAGVAQRLYSSFHREYAAANTWVNGVTPTLLSGALTVTAADTEACAPRMASDSSGDSLVTWCGSVPGVYYNQFSADTETWSAPSLLQPATVSLLGVNYDNDLAVGADVGLTSSGNGYAVSVKSTEASGACVGYTGLFVRSYTKGVGFTAAPQLVDRITCVNVADTIRSPRIWVRSDGSSSIFYYRYNGATAVYSLYRIDGTTTGVFGAPVRVDDSAVTDTIQVSYQGGAAPAAAQILNPVLAYYGNYGTIAYVKPATTGGVPALFVSHYSASTATWSTPVTIDTGLTAGVGWYDVAAGPDLYGSGYAQFVYVYEGLSAASTPNLMRGRVYSTFRGGYTTQAMLGGTLTLLDPRPTAMAGPGGYAATLFMGLNTAARRAYVQSFR
jgi:hypothetical protein